MEDETGIANLVMFRPVFEKYRKEIMQARWLIVTGKLQWEGEVTHVVVWHCYNMNWLLQEMAISQNNNQENKKKSEIAEKAVQGELFPSRDFR